MQVRDLAQEQAVDLYFERNLMHCSEILSTGFGKSKVAIDIIKRMNPSKVLILVNSTILRDYSWRDEFEKFDALDIFDSKVEMQTYQTAYKWTKETKDLTDCFVVADEVDFAADTDQLSKFFYTYTDVRILGLTGFVTEAKIPWFDTYLPIINILTAAQAQESGILNNIKFTFIKYDLSQARTIKVDYKSKEGVMKSFMQSENGMYDHLNKKVFSLIADKDKINANFLLGQITKAEQDAQLKSLQYKIDKAVSDRSDLLLNSTTNVVLAKNLIQYIQASSDDKVIVFSKRTSQSELICGAENCYNGTVSADEAQSRFEAFQNGDKKLLGVCDKVNRGANISNLKTAIFESFFGADTDAVQKLGRLLRLAPGEIAEVFIFLPYYMRREVNNKYTVQETQQVTWARNMLKSTKVKLHTTWDYRVVKSNEPNE